MSPSAYITTRTVKSGKRFVVRFRIGGRYSPLIHAGSFRTRKDAQARRDFVISELAAGRNPVESLRALEHPVLSVSFSGWYDRFTESRVDVGSKTHALYRNAKATLGLLADRAPHDLTPADFQEWVALNAGLSPKTLRHYLGTHRQVLDFAGVEPNPARSPRVKLPTRQREEPQPPSFSEWEALLGKLTPRLVLPIRLMECCGLRVEEAVSLTWGDIDIAGERIRVSRARTKGGTAGQRWLRVPEELIDELDELLPLEDRTPGRLLFPFTDHQVRYAVTQACKLAKIAHYHPHDLRHRRISLWVAHGFDPITVKTWAGHANASMSLDVYSHVVIDHRSDTWRSFWVDVYTRDREARVRSEEAHDT